MTSRSMATALSAPNAEQRGVPAESTVVLVVVAVDTAVFLEAAVLVLMGVFIGVGAAVLPPPAFDILRLLTLAFS